MQSTDFFLKICLLIIWLNKYDPVFSLPGWDQAWEGNALENRYNN